MCKEVGLPSGVLNVVTGLGPEAGAPLSSHPDVDKVHIFFLCPCDPLIAYIPQHIWSVELLGRIYWEL